MRDALKFCSWALAKKNFVESLTHYRIANGRVQTFNGSITLSSPIDLTIECQPLGATFLKTVESCKEAMHMTMTPGGKLSIKSGKIRALIPCTEALFPEIGPEGREIALEPGLIACLGKLEPMIAEDASRPWARGILISGDKAFATNNVVIAEAELSQKIPGTMNIPHAAINELMRIKKDPSHMMLSDHSATFFYEDDRWLRTALLETEWPDIGRILNKKAEPPFVFDDDFWEALESLKIHVDEFRRLFIKPNFLTTSLDHNEASFAKIEGLPEGGCYDLQMLRMLKGVAFAIDFSPYPAPALWLGDGMRGAIIGRRF